MVFQLRAMFKIFLAVAVALPQISSAGQIYDVSGPDGGNDRDGTSHSGAASRAQDGSNGGDASVLSDGQGRLVKKGWDAGSLHLTLAVESNGAIKILGNKTAPESNASSQVLDTVPLTQDIQFLARGGRGGKGGDGGRGEDGGKGRDGSNATQYSNGTDGGRGGDGGNEGQSTDGGDAGRGGEITLRVGIRDNDLAMVLDRVDVAGNQGGAPGQGHGAGRGGAGGDGGSSYSWTEQVPETKTRSVSSTDSDGNTTYSTESYTEMTTVYHSNPGGSDGPSGSDGRRSSYSAKTGRNSESGKYQYIIVDENGQETTYERPYNLKLLPDYKLHGELNNNGFFEPGETISIQGISVVNSGKSPTPKYQKIKLFISDSNLWLRSDAIELTLPQVLNPGEKYTFAEDAIHFHLAELPRKEAGILRSKDVVGPQARVTRVEREFREFHDGANTQIKVQYPIEITPLDSLLTIAPGEVARAFFTIRNISQQTIGAMPALKARVAQTIFRRTGGATAENAFVMALDENSELGHPEQGILRAVEGLKPGEEKIIETLIGFQKTAEPYTEAIIQPELFLESILEKDKIHLAQFEPFTLRVSKTFAYTPDADVLLIANHNMNEKALAAFRATAALKQLKMDIWDFSYYGFFDFSAKIENYASLFAAYRGKTLILLGNEIQTPVGNTRVHKLVSPDSIIEAARRYGIKIVILNASENAKEHLAAMTTPVPPVMDDLPPEQIREFQSARQYLNDLKQSIQEVQEDAGNDLAFLGVEQISVTETRLFGEPTEERLRKTSMDLMTRVVQVSPEGRFFIDYTFKKQLLGTKFWFFKRWQVGDMNVRRSVDDSKTSIVMFNVDSAKIDNPDFILSENFQAAFDFSLNFSTKLKILNSIILGDYSRDAGKIELPPEFSGLRAPAPMDVAQILIQTILLDLLHEQITIRPISHSNDIARKELWEKMDLLKRLTHFDYSQFKLDAATPEGELFVNLIARMKFFATASLAWWERFLPFNTKNKDVSQITDEMLARLVATVFPDSAAANKIIQDRTKVFRSEARSAGVDRAGLVAYLDQKHLAASGLRDGQVNQDPEGRVRSEATQAKLREADKTRIELAKKTREAIFDINHRLKLQPGTCQAMLEKVRVAGSGAGR